MKLLTNKEYEEYIKLKRRWQSIEEGEASGVKVGDFQNITLVEEEFDCKSILIVPYYRPLT